MRSTIMAGLVVGLVGCGTGVANRAATYASEDSADVTAAPKFMEVVDYLDTNEPGASGNWYGLTQTLTQNFNDICGDTFCDGDYADIQAMEITCSVDVTHKTLKTCQWTFMGSYDEIYKTSGNILTHTRTWKCALPFTGTPDALVTALTSTGPAGTPDALHRTLPGSTQTTYDAIGNCLSGT